MRIEPKLRTSIVEGISVFPSLFDDSPRVRYTFCPRKDLSDPASNPNRVHGTPLMSLANLLEHREVPALNVPVATNPGLARALGTLLINRSSTFSILYGRERLTRRTHESTLGRPEHTDSRSQGESVENLRHLRSFDTRDGYQTLLAVRSVTRRFLSRVLPPW
jgi:hypothetical protein